MDRKKYNVLMVGILKDLNRCKKEKLKNKVRLIEELYKVHRKRGK